LSAGYGQPFFVFNPPLVYYLAEVWLLVGMDPVTALNLTCALLVAASAAAMFLLGRLWFGMWGGWLAAAAYLYAPYFHVDLFVRQALAEFAAFPFYPLALYGFGRFARDRDLRFLLLGAAGYAGVIAAHHPAAFLFSPLLLSFVVFQAAQAKSWKLLLTQLGGLTLGVGLGASVWLPALLEREFVKLDLLLEGYLQFTNHFVFLQQLFYTNWGYGLSLPGYEDGMSFSLGWSHVLLVIAGWAAARHWRPDKRQVLGFFTVSCALLCVAMLAGSEWFWATLPLMKYVEFPWRLLAPASLCLAVLAAAAGHGLDGIKKARRLALAAALGLLILPNLSHIGAVGYQTLDWRQWTPEQIAQRGVGVTTRNEYESRWAQSPAYRADAARVVAGWAQGDLRRFSPVLWSGQIQAASQSTIEISCYYFPGWQAWIDDREVPIELAEDSGLIRLVVPAGEHRVRMAFRRTPVRTAADAISVLSALALVGLWVWIRRTSSSTPVQEDALGPAPRPETG
jgi:hypothetical protein